MKVRFAPVLAFLSLLSGCYLNGRLYPVQGPAAAQTPPPIYAARISGGFRSGSFTAILQDGERCTGTWAQVSTKPSARPAPDPTISQADISRAWDAVYGPGFYTAHVLGAHIHIHGVLSGDKGTVLQVDAYRNPANNPGVPDSRRGVAFDSHTNIYKLVF
jgi:hypothetical protein